MKVALAGLILLLILAVPVKTNAAPSVNPLPWLHVQGNRIVDENGLPTVLRGVAVEDQCDMYFTNRPRLDESGVAELVQNWQVNVIRIPIDPDYWGSCPNYLQQILDPIVALGSTYGTYILLGWHAHGNPITGQGGQKPYNPNMTLAANFWNSAAEHYKNDPWVIYSIFDEPSYISWSDWRPQAEQLIDIIRSHNPQALILVPGVSSAYDLRGVEQNPVQRLNIVYEVHPYPAYGKALGPWDDYFGYLTNYSPVFAGEWGFSPSLDSEPGNPDPGLSATAESYGMPLLAYMTQRNISWTAWCWSPYWAPVMLNPQMPKTDYVPTEFGQVVKNSLNHVLLFPVRRTTSDTTTVTRKAITSNGGASIDTSQSKFGGGNGKFAGSRQYLTAPDSPDWYFGAGDLYLSTRDFTIDFWARFNALPTSGNYMGLVSQWTDTTNWWAVQIKNTAGVYTFYFRVMVAGSIIIDMVTTSHGLSTNTWYHIAVARSGTSFYIFQDGTQLGTTGHDTDAVPDFAGSLYVGGIGPISLFNGWLDELRISKGIARWTSNFTPPTAPYSRDSQTVLLLHMDGSAGSTIFLDA